MLVALLLGLRHATDPDHLTAVSTLVLAGDGPGARKAGTLGLAWGLGHATTIVAFGLPIVLFQRHLPGMVHRGAEAAIGALIVALAVRLLIRWRRGYFHVHAHSHGPVRHAHPHVHEHGPGGHAVAPHRHGHADALGQSPAAAYGIGLVHGIGGSAMVGLLVAGAAASPVPGALTLLLFAAGTAISMAMVSAGFGFALAQAPVSRLVGRLMPLVGLGSLAFGLWYAAGAVL